MSSQAISRCTSQYASAEKPSRYQPPSSYHYQYPDCNNSALFKMRSNVTDSRFEHSGLYNQSDTNGLESMLSSARQTLRSGADSGRVSKKMKKHGKLLNKTDMILM